MNPRIKKILVIFVDVLLIGYLTMAITAFNKPDETIVKCENVNIVIVDATTNGFINQDEVKSRMVKNEIYPKGKSFDEIDCRVIEDVLKPTPFVRNVECYKTQNGDVNISVSQRMPIVRIKAENGSDYYIDDKDCIMPKSDCTADIVVATGNINESYAKKSLSPFARAIMNDDFARNLVEQINVTNDMEIEIIPRLGSHIVFLGRLPQIKDNEDRELVMKEFVQKKFTRLNKFYKYGLSKNIGWDVYSDIDLEYDNQIICKRKEENK